MKRYSVVVFVLALLMSVYPVYGNQNKKIADNYPFETALELSKTLDRQIIFSFVSSGCPYCEEFKNDILSDPGVKEMLNSYFVLSLVSIDESFKINLPEKGEVTNIQLASGLGVEGTPTTFIFYPPDPGLIQEDRVITKFDGTLPDPESMIKLLDRVVTESFKEENNGSTDPEFYNYKPSIKKITIDELNLVKETSIEIPIITEKLKLSSLPEIPELIVNFSEDSAEEYSERVVSETDVRKVYFVES